MGDSLHPRCEKDTLLSVPLPKSQGEGRSESWLARDLSREGGGRKRFFPKKLIRACKEGLLPPRERDKVEREIDSKLTIATQPAAKASGSSQCSSRSGRGALQTEDGSLGYKAQ